MMTTHESRFPAASVATYWCLCSPSASFAGGGFAGSLRLTLPELSVALGI